MMWNAELQTSAFLKGSVAEWRILKPAWFGKRRHNYVFWGVFKGNET